MCIRESVLVFMPVGQKRAWQQEWPIAHNFQMDSQTCARFSRKFGHEPKDGRLTVLANWQKGAWRWEWPVNKRQITPKQMYVTWPNFARVCPAPTL